MLFVESFFYCIASVMVINPEWVILVGMETEWQAFVAVPMILEHVRQDYLQRRVFSIKNSDVSAIDLIHIRIL